MAAPAADLPPHLPPPPPEPPSSDARGGVSLLGWTLWDLRLVLLVQDSCSQQPLQGGLVHPQLGPDAPLRGEDGVLPAQRAADEPVAQRSGVSGPRRQAQGPQAALAEAVFAAELPGAAETRVVGPVTNRALDL